MEGLKHILCLAAGGPLVLGALLAAFCGHLEADRGPTKQVWRYSLLSLETGHVFILAPGS